MPTIRCGLLSAFRHEWAASIALACPDLDFVTLSPSALGLPSAPNAFGLPQDDRAEVVLLGKSFYEWLEDHHPDRLADCMERLERIGVVVALDGADEFALGFPPWALERVTLVIKTQGLYRDRELYNYFVGPWYPGAIWTEKVRPRRDRYRPSDLEKLRLSVPCFMVDFAAVRREARATEAVAPTVSRHMSRSERVVRNAGEALLRPLLSAAQIGGRPLDVHCVAALSHIQRLEVMRLLEGFSGRRGITGIGNQIAGTGHIDAVPWYRTWNREPLLPPEVLEELAAASDPYRCDRRGRIRFLLEQCRHKVVVAPTGYGELCHGHASALRSGGALVCQDLSHVEMMFPLVDRRNAVFCRPDLSDLRALVEELLDDEPGRRRIAAEGRRNLTAWEQSWREQLRRGIEAPILEALGR